MTAHETVLADARPTAEIQPASPRREKGTAPVAARGPPDSIPIVAIGASSGGLEAASRLLDAIPPTSGMAFIIVVHLDPFHKSMMVDLLADHTTMKIDEAVDGGAICADHIYVIPPGRYLSVHEGALALSPQQANHGARLPFDVLLESLAKERGHHVIAVILSGTGADGSGGLAALKAAGGYAIAQDPEEADYDGMPRSAIDTGLIDRVLALEDIPAALAERRIAIAQFPAAPTVFAAPSSSSLNDIIGVLNEKTAHDFRQYKTGTLERRIERRIGLLALAPGNFAGYLELLRTDPAERDLLAKDLLINVTRFFRDPAIFDALAQTILPDLVRLLPERTPLRIWVAGCSTGEEAYSIGMLCRDAIKASGRDIKLQLFASDVDPDAVAIAREGLYPFDIENTVPADQLTRFFVRDEAGYRVATGLRGDVVFTVQDVLSDPPFSKIDLVSCRNLLIYLNPEAQAKVISLFHFALREGGVLVLGSSETVGKAGDRFEVIAKSERFYRHVARGRTGNAGFSVSFGDSLPMPGTTDRSASPQRQSTLADICRRAVIATHAPAAILINRKRQCLYSMGPTDRYLRIPPGYASLDLLAMASPTLRTKLRLAIDKVSKAIPRVDGGRARVMQDGTAIWFRLDVQAVADGQDDMLLVCFVEEPGKSADAASSPNRGDAARVSELERELEATQAELQTSILNQETSSQEQKVINEEALSVNEEFQSTNEELLTSKEELQSLNEELTALNSQLQETLERQRLTSDDLQNVLYSTNVATLFLDMDLKIRFYTPAIKSVFNIIAGDIGRPIADLRSIATDPDLLGDARKVLADHALIDREISGPNGTWFLRRVFPYRAHDDAVEGVVITFADTTDRKITAKALEAAKIEADRANLAKSRFLAAASHDLRQPLQSLTLLQELLNQTVEGEKPRKLLSRQGQTLAAMSGMLNALLDINQIEAGVVEAKPAVFPIADVLDLLRDEFSYLAQARNLSLHILPSAALVLSDATLLTQMIRNLLGNAIKYTRKGRILLGCRRSGDTLRIEVWDTGIGIAADQLHAVFEEFHQIDNAARERSLGLGLGLSIVQRLGHLLGHAVDVRSQPDKGSVFTITLPCPAADPAGPVAGPSECDAAPSGHRRTCKIVVVEDDPDVVELLEQLLKSEGHIVKTASDAAAAISLVAGSAIKPELLLTDYNLPGGMDGIDLLRSLRASLPRGLPAIVLTGDISSEALARIAGQDCVQLSKPVKARDLTAAIEHLMAGALPSTWHVPGAGAITGGSVAYVVDDDPHVLTTIREVLEDDGRMVEDFPSAEAFLAAYRPGNDGCLLVDAHLTGMSGVALIEALRARGNHLPAILITGTSDIGLAVSAMRSGACDFIEKPVGRVELLASIARAIDQSHDLRLRDAAQEQAAAHVGELTGRQREVMDLVLAGHPSKNIATDLGISQRTVENHRAAVMHKMQAKSLPELARIAQAAADGKPANGSTPLPPSETPAATGATGQRPNET
ncbi:chemotaxis protein CheB [Sphingomonas sp. PAMC 26621]|uniref:chemotaxis protein CheB n=1 Tax=Sphingomonas sp. PAMC 26621 TaxID=1112213 RepID=UPI0009DB478B|nr:chemotaxis protein CheB [Sphingomonas sp. PAMC 26621]